MKRSSFVLIPGVLLTGCMYSRMEVPTPPTRAVADPPSRVARLSYISGPVSFKAAGSDSWIAAVPNRPLTVGDELWTDRDARAELDMGHAFARVDSRTSIGILNLDDRGVQIKVSEGTTQVRLRRLDEEDEFELATPQAAIALLRTGDYRLEVTPGGAESELTVRAGQAEVTTPGQAFSVRPNQRARITGADKVSNETLQAPPLDGFDNFCQSRDRRNERVESLQYVSPYVIGWEDLDEFGAWRVHAVYGHVWAPRVVAPGWAPYRFGHWVWIEPWGW